MKNLKLIIHDWDDIVTNSFEAYSQFYFDFADYYNLPEPTIDGIRKHWGKTIPQIAHGQWQNLKEEKVEQMIRDFIHDQEQKAFKLYRVKILPGIVDAFKILSQKYILAVLSSGYRPRLMEIYKNQIDPNISFHKAILAPPNLKITKPDPGVFDEVYKTLGLTDVDDSEVLYVGDSISDLETAKNRGIEFYAVTTGIHTKKEFTSAGLDENHILEQFSELVKILSAHQSPTL